MMDPREKNDLSGTLNDSARNFTMVAHRARSDSGIALNDLCGASGRWDGVARSITSSLFLSHDLRRDTSVHVLLLGPDDPPKLMSVNGRDVKYLNPDERASSALMRKCLGPDLPSRMGSRLEPSPGITLTRADLASLLRSMDGSSFLLDESGETISKDGSPVLCERAPLHFILSDDQDLTEDERSLIDEHVDGTISLCEKVLHTNQAITVLHYLLDQEGI
ncbi:MAG: hypothetical protein R6V01_05110 [Thermoplasmatota archaeon]